jgi:UDP-2-acetamido-2-deoxy-ribo-hexuluronate aminotransferase
MSAADVQQPPLPFIDLKAQYRDLKTAIDARIHAVLDHGQYILGPEVAELEQRLAARVGVKHCITCSSGTDALLLALMALGVWAGSGSADEIITSPFSFFATGEVIALVGAKPVFVDIEPESYNIDPKLCAASSITGRLWRAAMALIASISAGWP